MTKLNFGYRTGQTLHGKAYEGDGTYIESNITMTEAPAGNGIYNGDTTDPLDPGDVIGVYDILTSDVGPVGFGTFDATVSDVIVDVSAISGVIANIYSDTVALDAQADSHVLVIQSDIDVAVVEISTVLSDVASSIKVQKSNLNSLLSDLALIWDAVRTQYHEYHL